MELLQRIQTLSDIPGVSGCEDLVRGEIIRQLDGVGEHRVDPLGNLLVFKKGARSPGQPLMLCAHMDEVGFVVTHVEESGLLRFATVGGIDSRVIVGRAVEVGPERVYGLIGTKAIHLQKESEQAEAPSVDKLFIDIGAATREQALELISPGDRAIFHTHFRSIGEGNIMGRALDDRAGCALLLQLLHEDLPWDCHFAFTVQEEIGCVGAVTAGYTVHPGLSLVVETTTASDLPGVEPAKVVCSLGKGPVLSFMDRGAIYDDGLYRLALDTARKQEIPCQVKEGVFGGNDSRSVQRSREGVRVLAVSMPCRYLHTANNLLRGSDIDNTLLLLRALLEQAGAL